MASYGFVYMLANEHMPDLFKVGFTERSPHQRAAELSSGSGVPSPFSVMCFIEVENPQEVERKFHQWLNDYRVSPSREFFSGCSTDWIVSIFYWYPSKLSFTEVDLWSYLESGPLFNLSNPYQKNEKKEEKQSAEDVAAKEIARIATASSETGGIGFDD